MESPKTEPATTPLPSFDVLEIDSKLSSSENSVFTLEKSKFSFFPSFDPKNKPESPDEDFPKYFSFIDHKLFKYTGVLSKELRRDLYGYSFFENRDEYLGEYKTEKKNGFGIYKWKELKDSMNENYSPAEIFIGEYKDNKKDGKGIYLSIIKKIEKENKIIYYDCAIGEFKEDSFIGGKIFSLGDGSENLFVGRVNELGLPDDDNALVVEEENKIFVGKVKEGNMVEGRSIFLDDKGIKKKAYYFVKKEEGTEGDGIEFNYEKNMDKDDEVIEKVKNMKVGEYKVIIQGIYEKVFQALGWFKDFDKAKNVNFENEVKKSILDEVDKLIE